MSYSKCFICGADNYSGNETRISVHRVEVDKETLEHLSTVWQADICDECLEKHFGILGEKIPSFQQCVSLRLPLSVR